MSAVHLQQIRKAFAGADVLKGVDIDVKEHEFLVFVGPSGCGKSTLLRSIAGLERIDSGRVVIEGEDVTELEPSERGVAMVFQSYALYPHMSVYENIAFGLRMIKLPEAQEVVVFAPHRPIRVRLASPTAMSSKNATERSMSSPGSPMRCWYATGDSVAE